MADIMPPPTPAERDPWALVDGCPNCVANVEAPVGFNTFANHWLCSYACADCGHVWSTSWGR